mgnify:CR=1 FL=1
MIINNNMMSLNAQRAQTVNASGMGKSLEKLSTGQRVNRAADDAAGLTISEKMRSQVRGLNQASRNAQDGISAVQTAEGALDEVHSMLQRMRELTVQAGNDTNQAKDREAIKAEIDQLYDEIDSISTKTEFNKQKLLNGSFAAGKKLQVGANEGQTLTISIGKMGASAIGLLAKNDLKVESNQEVSKSIKKIDDAIEKVSTQRSKLGAVQNRLEHTIKNLDNAAENTQAAESRIRDTNMAKEMSTFTKNNVLSQAAQAMISQANQVPQQALQLLR